MADNEEFLMENRDEFIQNTRNPVELADFLLKKKCITKELYNKIFAKDTTQGQNRECFACLNSKTHFNCAYDWFKKHEAALIKELRNEDEDEDEGPNNKRSRRETQETMDKADNTPAIFPDLKIISTFAKLENWLSEAENSKRLIEYLETKLEAKHLMKLKKELKDKELKTSLCFNAKNIVDIKKNKELENFLNAKTEAIFPKLIFSMFFKKKSSASSEKKAKSSSDEQENMDTIADYLNSSGYVSNKNSTQNDDETPDDVSAEFKATSGFNENEDKKDVKKTLSDGQPQPSGQTPKESPFFLQEEKTLLPITQGSVDMPEIEEANAHTSTSGAEPSCSNPEPASGTNKMKRKKGNMLEKKKQTKTSLFRDWAVRECKGGEIKNILNQISIINKAEHPDYHFFTAENIHLYKNPTTNESQILFITAEKASNSTKATLQYLMFVCKVEKAVLFCPEMSKEQEIKYDGSFTNKCLRFIYEAFAPALALFKKIQKEEFDSLICG